MTLLEVVQNIMSSLSLEEINSIEDVPESIQIAEVVKETYYSIVTLKEWEFTKETFSLIASGDNAKPVQMKIPKIITDIEEIRYLDEGNSEYKVIDYITPYEFLEISNIRKADKNADKISGMLKQVSTTLNIKNNKDPEYWTSFDEEFVVFDSYNSKYDTTLQENKTLCHGSKLPEFSIDDTFEIDMPEDMIWAYLLPESKSVASVNLLQTVNQKEEQRSRRGFFKMMHSEPKTVNKVRRAFPRYGRK